jgi:hypothetical protein
MPGGEDESKVVFIEFPQHAEPEGDPVAELEAAWAPLDAMIIAYLERRGDQLGIHRLTRIERQTLPQD